MPLKAGTKLGPYEILAPIGAGGMGEVYRALDPRLGREVAVKVLPEHLARNRDALARFEREAKAIAALSHPNILAIHDFGSEEGLAYAVTELLEGETLRSRLEREALGWRRGVEIAEAIAGGLAAAHTKGVVHRDLKPENLFLTTDGRVKILDFGLARFEPPASAQGTAGAATVSEPGTVMGTIGYMSPEQIRGEPARPPSDLFSLGVVLYEMITGRRAFSASTGGETLAAILRDTPPEPAKLGKPIPPELDRILTRCLEKSPGERFQSAQDLAFALKSTLSSPAIAAVPVVAATWRPRAWIAGGAAALILVAVVAAFAVGRWRRTGPERIESLAVLPLDNLSGDPAQDYFADGMTEALLTGLGKIRSLRVSSRSAVMKYKGQRSSLAGIARELKVDALVEGSVVRSGDRVRVSARLIHPGTDRQLWAESYERDLRDILGLQGEVARAIAVEIRTTLSPPEKARLEKARPVNPEAHDFYLRGKFLHSRVNEADNRAAVELLEHAVTADPGFAPGQAALAQAYVNRFLWFAPGEQKQLEQKAYAATEKALALDTELGEAYLARGMLLWTPVNRFAHDRAALEIRRALALNPNLDEAHMQLSRIYVHIGFFPEALAEASLALEINPSFGSALHHKAEALLYQGQREEALAGWQSMPRTGMTPASGSQMAWVLFQLGRRREAGARIEEFTKEDPEDTAGVLNAVQAAMLAATGDRRGAEEKIRKAAEKREYGHFHHAAYFLACAYARMNQPQPAVEWLEKAADTGLPCYPLFARDPNLDPLRRDAGFTALLERTRRQWEGYKAALFGGRG